MSIAIIVNSQLRDKIARYMEHNGIEVRLVETNAILVETTVSEIDPLMTFFPLSVDGQTAAIAACMLLDTEQAKVRLGTPNIATLPFHTVGELPDGDAQNTLMLGYLHPNSILYKTIPAPEFYPSVSGADQGGIFILWRGTRTKNGYDIHALDLEDGEIVAASHRLITKAGVY